MSGKYALIIGNTEYTDPGLAQLTAPGKDAKEFVRVLDSPEICAFDDVVVLFNENAAKVAEAIDYFLSNRKQDDLLVLYFSGHGVRDEYGTLYLAVKNTNRARLRSTAIKSDFISEAMDQSRSKRQVLILDCCNSGAFAQGTKAVTGASIGTASAFEGTGYGRVVLTASDSTQFAWEGDRVIGETENSLFTHFLIKGLEGEADLDGDGSITVDELYDYAYELIVTITPKQTPGKWSYKQQGEIVLRQSIRMEDIKAVPLPPHLISAMENPDPDVRLGTVQSLAKLLAGKNMGLARSAREALERMVIDEDSRRVAEAAAQALESIHREEQVNREKARAARKARHEALRLAANLASIQTAEQETPRLKVHGKVAEDAAVETKEKVAHEKTHRYEGKITDASPPLPVHPHRERLLKWARVAGIVGGLCVLGSVLVWLGITGFPPFAIVPTESTDIVTIVSTSTLASTTTPSLIPIATFIPSLTSSEESFPSPTNNNSPNPVATTRISSLTSSLTPSIIPSLTPTDTLSPTPTTPVPTTPNPCGTLPTRVSVGMTIRAATTQLGIRPQPTLAAARIFQLPFGAEMRVLDGPVCSDESYFWYISSEAGEGWAREGNNVIYFVDPLP